MSEVLTVALYWSLLECGLALIAACLPTLSYLFTRLNLQSAVDSVRSVFSLASLRSSPGSTEAPHNKYRTRFNSTRYIDIESHKLTALHADVAGTASLTSQEHPLHDLEGYDAHS